jgi:prefoldin subunit 5
VGALLLSTLLGAGLSLVILATINGSLSYARPGQIDTLSRRIDGVNSQAEILQQDLEAVRNRVDNLEALSGRVGKAEKAIDGLQGDLTAVQTDIESLQSRLGELDQAMSEIQARTNRFQTFLEGLRDLMGGIFKP